MISRSCNGLIQAVYLSFSLHVRLADQLLSQLPSDITFEICSSSSPSSPVAPTSSTPSSVTHGGGDDEGTGAFIKAERVVSGVHFLTDRAEEDRADLLLSKSEGESEPEVRKQVGWCPRYDFSFRHGDGFS